MKKIDRKYKDALQDFLEANEDEKKAIYTYYDGNINYKLINELLGAYMQTQENAGIIQRNDVRTSTVLRENSDPKDYYYFDKDSVKEKIELLIKLIPQIYSAMYKSSTFNHNFVGSIPVQVGRGASHGLLNKDEHHGFISTSYRFKGGYGNALSLIKNGDTLSKISVDSDVPAIGVGAIVDNGIADNENELLVSPFVRTEEDRLAGRENSLTTKEGKTVKVENVIIKNEQLKKMPKEEQEKLQASLMAEVEMLEQKTIEYYIYMHQYDALDEKKSFYGYDAEKADKAWQKAKKCKDFVLEWKTKFRKLMEAKCADIEMSIDAQIDEKIQNVEKQKIAQEQKINNGFQKGEEFSKTINESIGRVKETAGYKKMIKNRKYLTQLGFVQDLPSDELLRTIDSIGKVNFNFVNDDTQAAIDDKNNIGMSIKDEIEGLARLFDDKIGDVINQDNSVMYNEVMRRVLIIRANQEGRTVENKEREVSSQKVTGLFGKRKENEKQKTNTLNRIRGIKASIRSFMNGINNGNCFNCNIRPEEIMAEIQIAQMGENITDNERRELDKLAQVIRDAINPNVFQEIRSEKYEKFSLQGGTSQLLNDYVRKIGFEGNNIKQSSKFAIYIKDIKTRLDKIREKAYSYENNISQMYDER